MESLMPRSIYRIDPGRDLAYAEEFRRNPVGHHSAGLQRILNVFRGEPLQDKYVLVCTKPHEEWCLARLSGVRGKAVSMVAGKSYRSLEGAEWDVFKMRWEIVNGRPLELTPT
jgi:hypothetical protein